MVQLHILDGGASLGSVKGLMSGARGEGGWCGPNVEVTLWRRMGWGKNRFFVDQLSKFLVMKNFEM